VKRSLLTSAPSLLAATLKKRCSTLPVLLLWSFLLTLALPLSAQQWSQIGMDIAANPTILSGDIGTPSGSADNVQHVVLAAFTPTTPNTRLDGFTITAGNANVNSFITVKGGTVFSNSRGGLFTSGGTNTLTNNSLSGNAGSNGTSILPAGTVVRLMIDAADSGNRSPSTGLLLVRLVKKCFLKNTYS
jgi:hypothetical protein